MNKKKNAENDLKLLNQKQKVNNNEQRAVTKQKDDTQLNMYTFKT